MAEDLKKPRMSPARLVHSDSRNQTDIFSKSLRAVRELLPLVIQIFTDKFFYRSKTAVDASFLPGGIARNACFDKRSKNGSLKIYARHKKEFLLIHLT